MVMKVGVEIKVVVRHGGENEDGDAGRENCSAVGPLLKVVGVTANLAVTWARR